MTPLQKDGLIYIGTAFTGGLLAKSFGAKMLGVAIGSFGGLALAALTILNKPRTEAF